MAASMLVHKPRGSAAELTTARSDTIGQARSSPRMDLSNPLSGSGGHSSLNEFSTASAPRSLVCYTTAEQRKATATSNTGIWAEFSSLFWREDAGMQRHTWLVWCTCAMMVGWSFSLLINGLFFVLEWDTRVYHVSHPFLVLLAWLIFARVMTIAHPHDGALVMMCSEHIVSNTTFLSRLKKAICVALAFAVVLMWSQAIAILFTHRKLGSKLDPRFSNETAEWGGYAGTPFAIAHGVLEYSGFPFAIAVFGAFFYSLMAALRVTDAAADSVCMSIKSLSIADEESRVAEALLRTSSKERTIPVLADDIGPMVHFFAIDVLAKFSEWWGGPIAWITSIIGLSGLILVPQLQAGNSFLAFGVVVCAVFATIPLLIPAAATTRCVEILALLNQQRAFSNEDGTLRGMVEPEIDARISTICRFLTSLNNGIGPGFTIYGVPVSRQYLTVLGIKVVSIAGALIPILISMQNKLDQINHANVTST